MSEPYAIGREVSRVVCLVHERFGDAIVARLRALGVETILMENARCVRQRMRARRWNLPGYVTEWDEAPFEMYRTTVESPAAGRVLRELWAAAELELPGRGSLYAQEVIEHGPFRPPPIPPDAEPLPMPELALITVFASLPAGGELAARSLLKLGAGVPVIRRGEGTGLRERLGLLRITIPPEKEIVQALVPRHDAAGLQRLLIEEARMDRPGGGFLFITPVRAGRADPLLRVGRQTHAASMEQIIAALDDLKGGTVWRKRYEDPREGRAGPSSPRGGFREISFVCAEGGARDLVRAALAAGAGGATVSRARSHGDAEGEGRLAARECGSLCVADDKAARVVAAIAAAAQRAGDTVCRIQTQEILSVFSHAGIGVRG